MDELENKKEKEETNEVENSTENYVNWLKEKSNSSYNAVSSNENKVESAILAETNEYDDFKVNSLRLIKTDMGLLTEDEYVKSLALSDKEKELKRKRESKKSVSAPLILSLIGLILSIFGSGFIFSIIAFCMAQGKLSNKKSQTLYWARNLAICGFIMSITFSIIFIIMGTMLSTPPTTPPVAF